MFTDKENINILTALLVAHGVRHAVVCPGSRNAAIVHNLNECGDISCTPVTDERSAGFYALGMAQATKQPVVVCVTSGTALLNLAPAVAEAFYQHVPLVVVSADRPAAWIDQLDGQTLPQTDALGRFVQRAVSLPEPKDDTERWACNRMVNEALYTATLRGGSPVHINVPITEPLFNFTVEKLPTERVFKALRLTRNVDYSAVVEKVRSAEKPMVVLGQTRHGLLNNITIKALEEKVVVIREPLSSDSYSVVRFDEVLHAIGKNADYMPDTIIYIGDTVVSKRARKFLRLSGARTVFVTPDASRMNDPLMGLTDIVECEQPNDILDALAAGLETGDFHRRWHEALRLADDNAETYEPRYSQMAAVKYFEEQLVDMDYDYCVHYANSSAIRLANIYAGHYVWCNRGVNGIEGSLSTAAGFSLATGDTVFCIVGDLSFFYDQNALWNARLRGNLRIVLLNNGCGGIFHQLPGLDSSPARDTMVSASHHTEARGICTQNDIGYIRATNTQEMQMGIVRLLTEPTKRPMVLEIATKPEEDTQAMRDYYSALDIRNI